MHRRAEGDAEHALSVRVVSYSDEFKDDFARLNLEWIEKYFEVEEPDRKSLSDPRGTIIDPGGEIFFILENGTVVGTCALIRHSAELYELAKMAVTPQCQGRGLGQLLIESVIDDARAKGAKEIFLLSNTVLIPAVRLYEKYGFRTVHKGPHPEYNRANIEMVLQLDRQTSNV